MCCMPREWQVVCFLHKILWFSPTSEIPPQRDSKKVQASITQLFFNITQTEVLRTPSVTQLGFEPMTSGSWTVYFISLNYWAIRSLPDILTTVTTNYYRSCNSDLDTSRLCLLFFLSLTNTNVCYFAMNWSLSQLTCTTSCRFHKL